jgi:hypothetical protein
MKVYKLSNMVGGWFVGNFMPTAFKTTGCEVSLKQHTKGEYLVPHSHHIATEINLVIKGSLSVHGMTFGPGDIFVMEPDDVADPVFFEDSDLMVVKVPSVIGDKYEAI